MGILSSFKGKMAAADAEEKPLPTPERPGTSGTEMNLMTTRKQASQRLKAASQAERAYRARKRSATARANLSEAKAHLGDALGHFKTGTKLLISALGSSRYILANKAEERRAKAGESKRQAAAEKRRKLEERLAKEKELADADAAAANAANPASSS
ncbi:hypothetical protein RB597_006705 [Gaeumannomyces tritici]